MNKIASIIDAATRDLEEDNYQAEQRAKRERMVAQVEADMKLQAAIYKKVFPRGATVSVKEEVDFLRDHLVAVSVKN